MHNIIISDIIYIMRNMEDHPHFKDFELAKSELLGAVAAAFIEGDQKAFWSAANTYDDLKPEGYDDLLRERDASLYLFVRGKETLVHGIGSRACTDLHLISGDRRLDHLRSL